MDKDTFISMSPTKRVQEVNKMLQKYDLKEISKLLGIPSSTFSKLMREITFIIKRTRNTIRLSAPKRNERQVPLPNTVMK